MAEYIIDVSKIEEWQMTGDMEELDKTFVRSRSTIVQGGSVILARTSKQTGTERFDEITNEEDLEEYKKKVYRFFNGGD